MKPGRYRVHVGYYINLGTNKSVDVDILFYGISSRIVSLTCEYVTDNVYESGPNPTAFDSGDEIVVAME
jgi:hypothetical protein